MKKKNCLFGMVYGLILFTFTLYILLDTFAIKRVYQIVPQDIKTETSPVEPNVTFPVTLPDNGTDPTPETEQIIGSETMPETEAPDTPEVVQNENYYSDGSISVTLTEHRVKETTVYVADVVLSSPEYLKTAFAHNAYGRNITQKTSDMASANNAILAINGDYYGARERGYVLRNGVSYRKNGSKGQEALVIYRDGSFEIIDEGQISLSELEERSAQQVLSFGPALVNDSKVTVSRGQEVAQSMNSNPRTAIGIIEGGHYLIVVSDGRTSQSRGLSLLELAEFMQSLGATVAYNLDGGGSSTMYFCGRVVNNPTTNGKTIKERSVSDIVYIGY